MVKLLEKIQVIFARNIIKKIIAAISKIAVIFNPIKNFFKKNNDIFKPIVTLTAICLIVATALSLTNSLTAAKIEQMNIQNKNAEMAALIPAENYEQAVIMWETADPHLSLFNAKNGEEVIGYIVTTSAKGYGGEIVIMTAFNTDKSVKGISILNADNETPGLGQKVTTPEFYSQFIGLNTEATVVKNSADNSAGEIKALTGATISSKGAVKAVNEAREHLESYLKISETSIDAAETVKEQPEETLNENGGASIEE